MKRTAYKDLHYAVFLSLLSSPRGLSRYGNVFVRVNCRCMEKRLFQIESVYHRGRYIYFHIPMEHTMRRFEKTEPVRYMYRVK